MRRLIKFSVNPLAILILFCSIFFWVNVDNRVAQTMFFHTATIVLVALCIRNIWVTAFISWCVLNSYITGFPNYSLNALSNVAFGAMIYLAVTTFAKPHMLDKLFRCFLIVIGFNIFWMGWQKLNVLFGINYSFDFIMSPTFPEHLANPALVEPVGFFCLPAHMGAYASVITPIALTFVPYLTPLLIFPLWLSKSSIAMGGAVIGGLFWLYHYRHRTGEPIEFEVPFIRRYVKIFWVVLPLLVAGGITYVTLFDMPTGQFNRRLKVWYQTARLIPRKLVQGYGLGSLTNLSLPQPSKTEEIKDKMIVKKLKDNIYLKINKVTMETTASASILELKDNKTFDVWQELHNDPLQATLELGLIGLFLILGYLYDAWRKFKIMPKDKHTVTLASCMVVIVLNSLVNFPFHVARNGVPFLILMALFEMKYLNDFPEGPVIT